MHKLISLYTTSWCNLLTKGHSSSSVSSRSASGTLRFCSASVMLFLLWDSSSCSVVLRRFWMPCSSSNILLCSSASCWSWTFCAWWERVEVCVQCHWLGQRGIHKLQSNPWTIYMNYYLRFDVNIAIINQHICMFTVLFNGQISCRET